MESLSSNLNRIRRTELSSLPAFIIQAVTFRTFSVTPLTGVEFPSDKGLTLIFSTETEENSPSSEATQPLKALKPQHMKIRNKDTFMYLFKKVPP